MPRILIATLALLFAVGCTPRDEPLKSRVFFCTEKRGATFCYQLLARDGFTTTGRTPVIVDIPVGRYRIWTERDGVKTTEPWEILLYQDVSWVYVVEKEVPQ